MQQRDPSEIFEKTGGDPLISLFHVCHSFGFIFISDFHSFKRSTLLNQILMTFISFKGSLKMEIFEALARLLFLHPFESGRFSRQFVFRLQKYMKLKWPLKDPEIEKKRLPIFCGAKISFGILYSSSSSAKSRSRKFFRASSIISACFFHFS